MLEKGQSIFEVVIAIAISAIVMTVIVSLSTDSLSNSVYSRNKTLSNKYVSETIEWLRWYKGGMDWIVFRDSLAASSDWCMTDLPNDTTPPPPYDESIVFNVSYQGACDNTNSLDKISGSSVEFFRDMMPSLVNANRIDVTVKVSWREPDGWHETKSSTSLTNY